MMGKFLDADAKVGIATYGEQNPKILDTLMPALPKIICEAIGALAGIPFDSQKIYVHYLGEKMRIRSLDGVDMSFGLFVDVPYWIGSEISSKDSNVRTFSGSIGMPIKKLIPAGTSFFIYAQIVRPAKVPMAIGKMPATQVANEFYTV